MLSMNKLQLWLITIIFIVYEFVIFMGTSAYDEYSI